jgi:hypothetical protein
MMAPKNVDGEDRLNQQLLSLHYSMSYRCRNKQSISSLVWVNDNGSFFQPGTKLPKKTEVAKIYAALLEDRYPLCPTVNETANRSKMSWGFAKQVITELKALGAVVDPDLLPQKKNNGVRPGQKLSTIHEMFLLGLRTLDPTHPLYNYVQELNKHFGKLGQVGVVPEHF